MIAMSLSVNKQYIMHPLENLRGFTNSLEQRLKEKTAMQEKIMADETPKIKVIGKIEIPQLKHDLFQHRELWPAELMEVIQKYEQRDDMDDYRVLQQMLEDCNAVGYTFDYYLDAAPYGLRQINVPLHEIHGYEAVCDECKANIRTPHGDTREALTREVDGAKSYRLVCPSCIDELFNSQPKSIFE